jgi:arsenical pump membrane protein
VTTLVAVNVGPMLLAWGSLANLLWLRACRTRGLRISMLRFGLEGLLVVPLAVSVGVLVVWLTQGVAHSPSGAQQDVGLCETP